MKTQIIASIFILLVFLSCNNLRTGEEKKAEIPKALDDKSSFEISSYRGSGDLVESLYEELVNKTPALKEFETRLEGLARNKNDSTKLFDNFNAKNQSYFNSATSHTAQITDSLLRDKMKLLIAGSLAKYNSKISQYTSLLKSIEARSLTLADLHTVLKITRTLPVIEKYQNDNLPAVKPIEGYSKQLNDAMELADALIKIK